MLWFLKAMDQFDKDYSYFKLENLNTDLPCLVAGSLAMN